MKKSHPPIFVINLNRSVDRLNRIGDDFEAMGMSFTRVPAIDGNHLSEKHYSLYDADQSNAIHGRGLCDGEIGGSLSHLSIYEMMVDQQIPMAFVFEDDAVPIPKLASFINSIDDLPADWDMVKLVYETCSRDDPYCRLTGDIVLKQFDDRVAYATAYLLRLSGAKKLLDYGYPVRFAADGLTGRFVETGIRLYGTSPFCVDRSGLPSTINFRG